MVDLLCCQTILAAVLPPYLHHLSQQTDDSITKARQEMAIISSLSVSIRALVVSCEPLARSPAFTYLLFTYLTHLRQLFASLIVWRKLSESS